MKRSAASAVVAICTLSPGAALALPSGFVDEPVIGGWDRATGLTFAQDGRMVVWEKSGRVWTVVGGVRDSKPLIDISDEVGDWRDHGLLGFALDPGFLSNGYVYLLYVVDYYNLVHANDPDYDPAQNEYFHDTIGRLTRYTCDATDGFRSVVAGSRLVLIGESITTGFPIHHQSHGVGEVEFGEDGSLLVTCGDGASYETVDAGGPIGGSSNTALADGVITPKEDVGAFRAQLVDSLSGKLLRIDPGTGAGLTGNPFYDPARPRSARSRVWALGLRNAYRFTVRPGSGGLLRGRAYPGAVYLGDVGWNQWEELDVCTRPGQNFGWPLFEGMAEQPGYQAATAADLDAPNPLFDGVTCAIAYLQFRDLIVQDTLAQPSWPNPCNAGQQILPTADRFMHSRPVIDWRHPNGPSRTRIYVGDDAASVNLNDPASPVPGPNFGGFASIGGVWYTATDFPAGYRDCYYHADYALGWIRQFIFNAEDEPVAVLDFKGAGGTIVGLAVSPLGGGIYYVNYNDVGGPTEIRRIYCPSCVPSCAGDLTSDGVVGPPDVAALLNAWGFVGPNAADLDGDGHVGGADLAVLLGAWGPCP